MAIDDHVIALSLFALYPEPAIGWTADLRSRAIPIVEDDIGRAAIPRVFARELLTERRQLQELVARHRAEAEQRAVEADEQRRRNLPAGIPAGHVPEGVSAGMLMMLSDPENSRPRRTSVLQHALAHPSGELVYHPLNGESS